MTIEKPICLVQNVLGRFTALYISFVNCNQTKNAVWLYDRTCPNLLRGDKAPIPVPSDCQSGLLLDLSSISDGRSIVYSCGCLSGRLLPRTPGPVQFGTSICYNVETILTWTCHVYGPFEFRTSLGTSILLLIYTLMYCLYNLNCLCYDLLWPPRFVLLFVRGLNKESFFFYKLQILKRVSFL